MMLLLVVAIVSMRFTSFITKSNQTNQNACASLNPFCLPNIPNLLNLLNLYKQLKNNLWQDNDNQINIPNRPTLLNPCLPADRY
jgi:hypothetical protein